MGVVLAEPCKCLFIIAFACENDCISVVSTLKNNMPSLPINLRLIYLK